MISSMFTIPFYRTSIGMHTVDLESYDVNRDAWDGEMPTTFETNAHVLLDYPDLMRTISWHVFEFVSSLTSNQEHTITIESSWLNIGGPGDSQYEHDHIGYLSDISGVYYLEVPEEGEMRFRNPIRAYRHASCSRNFWQESSTMRDISRYTPSAGELILFPSFLLHQVMPQKATEGRRVSIAFNASVIYEEERS